LFYRHETFGVRQHWPQTTIVKNFALLHMNESSLSIAELCVSVHPYTTGVTRCQSVHIYDYAWK